MSWSSNRRPARRVFYRAAGALTSATRLRWTALLPGLALALGPVASAPAPALASIEGNISFHQGVSAYGAADYERAEELFEAALTADPEDASALHYLGLIAVQKGDVETAIDLLVRAVALRPEATGARIDLGAQLLKADREAEALRQFEAVLAREPDHPKALLYRGVALYRTGDYAEALAALRRAVELDSELAPEGHYYVGLAEAFRDELAASAAAFGAVASSSPQHPLRRSATSLRRQVLQSERRWSLAMTAGFEYDDNVTLSPDEFLLQVAPKEDLAYRIGSPAGTARLQGQVEAISTESLSWRIGYDGFLRVHTDGDARFLDEQTHVAWTHGTFAAPLMSFSVRYSFSYTALDLTDSFRTIHRISPTAYLPVGDWGLTLGYYQFVNYDYDYEVDPIDPAYDRSGRQHTLGLQQFVFPPEPFNFVVLGGLVTRFDSDGTEFRHKGFELSAGAEVNLFWKLQAGLLYIFKYRNYWENTLLFTPPPWKERLDHENEVSLNLDRAFETGLVVSIAGSYNHNSSNIEYYDMDRYTVGTYLTYAF